MTQTMTRQERMQAALRGRFEPFALEVVDESQAHAGHGEGYPNGESHYRVIIGSAAFAGKSRVQVHRLIHEALAAELQGHNPIHALSIQVVSNG